MAGLGVEEAEEAAVQAGEEGFTDGSDEPAAAKKAKRKAPSGYKKSASKRKKNGGKGGGYAEMEDNVVLTACKKLEKEEDLPSRPVLLSITHKADKVVLDSTRLSAYSNKGYRMVRATRGVDDGAWYFEITVVYLGPTGHTRLGWTTQKADVQTPVGYDAQGYAYRDLEGHKINAAQREVYAEGYGEGDVVGFYIHLPNGAALAPRTPQIYNYKGQPYVAQQKEEELKAVPGSEVIFFKNGVFQGVAYKDIFAGRYFPAASMYTLPTQDRCEVRFNFGPDFRFPPSQLGDRPFPKPMSDVLYHEIISRDDGEIGSGAAGGATGEDQTGAKFGIKHRSASSAHADGDKSKARREAKPKKKPVSSRVDKSGGCRTVAGDSESPQSVDLHAPVDVAIDLDWDDVSTGCEEQIEVEVQ